MADGADERPMFRGILRYVAEGVAPGERRQVRPSIALVLETLRGAVEARGGRVPVESIEWFRGEEIVAIRPGNFDIDGLGVRDRSGRVREQLPSFLADRSALRFVRNPLSPGLLIDTGEPDGITFTVTNKGREIDTCVIDLEGRGVLRVSGVEKPEEKPFVPRHFAEGETQSLFAELMHQRAERAKRENIRDMTDPWRRIARKWMVGWGPVTIPSGKRECLQVQPRVLFRGVGVINSSPESIEGLRVTGFFVGQKPQLPDLWFTEKVVVGSPLAIFFAECQRRQADELPKLNATGDLRDVGRGRGLGLDTCDPALSITFQVENVGDVPRVFCMAMPGVCILQER